MTNLPRHLDPQTLKSMVTPGMLLAMKSPEQGAATTIWAAVGKQWEGKGGKFLEDCSVSEPFVADDPRHEGWGPMTPGYAPYVYDQGSTAAVGCVAEAGGAAAVDWFLSVFVLFIR